MKRLYLLRHAKAKQAEGGRSDFNRGLAPRGRRAAPIMANHMRLKRFLPDAILCSSARRTRETLELLLPELVQHAEVEFDRRLYLASAEDILRRVRVLDDSVESALVIGHNPGLQNLAIGLAGGGDTKALRQMREKFPTAGLAVIHLDVQSWRQVVWERGAVFAFVTPADLT